jgi:hypothetical protein
MMRQRMPKSVAPSITAASRSSDGIVWKNCVSKYRPNALATTGITKLK